MSSYNSFVPLWNKPAHKLVKQASTEASIDPDLSRHVASVSHTDLKQARGPANFQAICQSVIAVLSAQMNSISTNEFLHNNYTCLKTVE